jgi:signal transduction histidine kinase
MRPGPAATRARWPRRVRTGLAGLAALGAGVGCTLALYGASRTGNPGDALWAGLVVVWAAAGATLAFTGSKRRAGSLVLAGTAAAGLAVWAGSLLWLHGSGHPVGSAQADLLAAVRAVGLALIPAVALQVLAAVPERPRPSGRHLVVSAYVLAAVVAGAVFASRPGLPWWIVGLEAAVVAGAAVVMSRLWYAKADRRDREALLCLWLGIGAGFEVALVGFALWALGGRPGWAVLVMGAGTALVPVGLVAAGRPAWSARVYLLTVPLASTVGLTITVASVYFLVVLGLGRPPTAKEHTVLLCSLGAAALAAVAYGPFRRHTTRLAMRVVYGERRPPDEVLGLIGNRLSRAIPLDELLLLVVSSLRTDLALRSAEIWTGDDGRYRRTVSQPELPESELSLSAEEQAVATRAGVSGGAWAAVWIPALVRGDGGDLRVAAITHAGRLLGLIVVSRREEDEAFREDEERVLSELARQLGLALHNVQLDSALQASLAEVRRQADELRASRARIVTAGDAERRRIERDIHDGAQQHLVALAVNIRLARQLAARDPAQAEELLEGLGGDVQAAIEELRSLAHGIYPPLLRDSGLAAALVAAANRSAVPVTVQVADIPRSAPEVEATVYFCCLEAIQNAAKHAGPGAEVTVTVAEAEGSLAFEVADDGVGFEPGQHTRGNGFVNMGDRLGALGGHLEIASAPGAGTRVAGVLPAAPNALATAPTSGN